MARRHLGEAEKLLEGFPRSPQRDGLADWARQLRGRLEAGGR